MKYPQLLNRQSVNDNDNDNDEIILELFIPKEIVFFDGHFPEHPILPGVTQVNWAINFFEEFMAIKKESIGELYQLKFTQIIVPETTLFLSLKREYSKLRFRYFDSQFTYSSGKMQVCD